jgi:hypothetical protein
MQAVTTAEERDTRTVIEDHLERSLRGDFEGDLEANYGAGVVFIEPSGIFFGHAGMRRAAEVLRAGLPNLRYEYVQRVTVGEIAYVVWRAEAEGRRVDDGVDTFVVESGKIVAQTAYYVIRGC